MKIRRILSLMVAVLILCAAMPMGIGAAATDFRYELKFNGNRYYGGDVIVTAGEEFTMSVENITVDGAAPTGVTYEWYKDGRVIPDATGTTLTATTNASVMYAFFAYDGGPENTIVSAEFRVKCDTLKTEVTSDHEIEEEGDGGTFYYVYDCKQGEKVKLSVEAETVFDGGISSTQGSSVSIKWYDIVESIYFSEGAVHERGELLSETGELEVTKTKGYEMYECVVDDGNFEKVITFRLHPVNTLDETVTINGVRPKRFERGYLGIVKNGDKATFKVDAKSTNGDVTYHWEKQCYDENRVDSVYYEVLEEKSNTLTVTKENVLPWDDSTQYECYVEDGNEIVQIGFIMFELDPRQVEAEAEIKEGTPAVSLDDDIETLANSLLQENMEQLQSGETAKIKLTAETQETPDSADKALVEEVLGDNSKSELYLDINIYKDVAGQQGEITETAKEIALSVDMPEDMKKAVTADSEIEVVRVHEGEAESIDCTYDEETGKVSFETDKFSTYVLALKENEGEEEKEQDTSSNQNGSQTGGPLDDSSEAAPTEKEEDKKPEGTVPPTGEGNGIAFALFTAAAAALTITKRKK